MIKQNYRLEVFFRGHKCYCYKNKWHRLNGPASIWPNGIKGFFVSGNKTADWVIPEKIK